MNQDSIERMWDQIENDLRMNNANMLRDRPYNEQPHTDTGIRGATEIQGISFRDLRDLFIRACCLSSYDQLNGALYNEDEKGEHAALCENDLYKLNFNKMDPLAIFQNLSCEIEKLMGIYPNDPSLKCDD